MSLAPAGFCQGSLSLGGCGSDPPFSFAPFRRPESNIAVVTHSSFLHFTCNSFGQEFSTHVKVQHHTGICCIAVMHMACISK